MVIAQTQKYPLPVFENGPIPNVSIQPPVKLHTNKKYLITIDAISISLILIISEKDIIIDTAETVFA